MRKSLLSAMLGALLIFFLVSLSEAKNHDAVKASYVKLPLSFVRNEGQKDKSVLFYEQGAGHRTAFTAQGISLSLTKSGKNNTARSEMVTLTPVDASPFTVEPLDKKAGKVNYFIGRDPSKWKTNIPTYGAILYKNIYPGIDMKFYGTNSQLEYDIIVSPHADPRKVRLSYKGIEKIFLTPQGELEIALKDGFIRQKKPVIYQTLNGRRTEIEGKFVLLGQATYGFEVGTYDRGQSLVIDPTLAYSTYLGGSGNDASYAIAVDSSGNAYVAGYTASTDFTATTGAYQTANAGGDSDVFITKLNPDGTSLVYSTYLGGSGDDGAYAIAVDSSGNAYVTGDTGSTNFPTTLNAYQTVYGGSFYDVFITKLNPDGTSLVYSTYLGGSGSDSARAIAVDSSGSSCVTGSTDSTNFPTTANAYQTTHVGGTTDAFVTKLDPDGTSLVYSTYLGGSGGDYALGIAVDSSGNAYVAGYTASTNFPTTANAYQMTHVGGTTDAFVTKLDPDGTSLIYSTYLGGTKDDLAWGIAVDSSRNAYVAGYTDSTNFTTTANAYQKAYAGGVDAFVTKLDPDGKNLVYSTYLGGTKDDLAWGIAVDSSGNAYAAGQTGSTDFPVTQNAYQMTYAGGGVDAFVAKLGPDGSALAYSTYLGGSANDYVNAIAVNSSGKTFVTGPTNSSDFPTTPNAYQTTYAEGNGDAFVTRLGSTLTVIVSGPGTVTSSPSGINCNSTCSVAFNVGEPVTLTATASPGYAFAYWSGGCSGASATCVVITSDDITATAVFDPITTKQYKLTLSKKKISGGDGTVASDDGVIQCGKTCGRSYYPGTTVTLAAHPSGSAVLAAWGGACSGTAPTCVVTMDEAKNVTATFAAPQKLTLNKQKSSNGNGTVTSDPPGITCETHCTKAYASFAYHETVTLTAVADSDTVFTGWSPSTACSVKGTNICTVTMDKARAMTAKFDGPRLLTVKNASVNGGSGRVTSSPSGIDCGETPAMAAVYFTHNSTIVLFAEADPGSTFMGWSPVSACTSTGVGTCTVTMDKAKSVTAKFTR